MVEASANAVRPKNLPYLSAWDCLPTVYHRKGGECVRSTKWISWVRQRGCSKHSLMVSLYKLPPLKWEVQIRRNLHSTLLSDILCLSPEMVFLIGIFSLGVWKNSNLPTLEFLSGFLPSFFLSTKCYSWKTRVFLFRRFFLHCMYFKTQSSVSFSSKSARPTARYSTVYGIIINEKKTHWTYIIK